MKKTFTHFFLRKFFLPALFILSAGNTLGAKTWNSDYSRWSVGANVGMPFFVGDMASFSDSKTYIGVMGGLQVGYQISPLWGVGLSIDYGHNKIGSYKYSNTFLLDPDGNAHCHIPDGVLVLPYQDLYGDVKFFSIDAHADLNINRLLYPFGYTKHWTVLVSPAVYLQKYSPNIYNITTDAKFTDGSLKNKLNIGLGGNAVLRYRVSRSVDLQLKSGLIWIADKNFDGIDCPSKSSANMSWNSSVGVVFKINNKRQKDNVLWRPAVPMYVEEYVEEVIVIVPAEVVEQPVKPRVVIADQIPRLPVIYFPRSGYDIDTDQYALDLDIIVTQVQKFSDKKITINGYCDHTGSVELNAVVGKKRIKSMYDYLTERGVDADRLSYGYAGVDDNLTGEEAYSEESRRVEVIIEK